MSLREAAEMALECLEFFRDTAMCDADTNTALEGIAALRDALAEADRANPMQCEPCGIQFADKQPGSLCPRCYREVTKAEAEKAEPVAWAISYNGKTPTVLWPDYDWQFLDLEVKRLGGTACKMPLYTHPPAALPESADEDAAIAKAWDRFTAELENPSPLTDEEILELWSPSLDGSVQRPILGKNKIIAFARSVLAAARGKG